MLIVGKKGEDCCITSTFIRKRLCNSLDYEVGSPFFGYVHFCHHRPIGDRVWRCYASRMMVV